MKIAAFHHSAKRAFKPWEALCLSLFRNFRVANAISGNSVILSTSIKNELTNSEIEAGKRRIEKQAEIYEIQDPGDTRRSGKFG